MELAHIYAETTPVRLAVGSLALLGDNLVLVPRLKYLSEDHKEETSTG